MKLRKSNLDDIDTLSKMAENAKLFMKKNNLAQWNENYPSSIDFIEQAKQNTGYCILTDSNEIVAYFSLKFGVEKNYLKTYEGKFKYDKPYATIHTAMVDGSFRSMGYSKYIFKFSYKLAIENSIYYLRIDTHKDNIPMRKSIENNGFSYSAVIKVEDGTDRLAFEKKVNINEL